MDSSNTPNQNEQFGIEFWERFWSFRDVEFQIIPNNSPFITAEQEFALLHDIELCYAAKAYYACLVLVFASIEIQIKTVKNVRKNKEKSFLSPVGLDAEYEWLKQLRHDIMHGNVNREIKYVNQEEDVQKLESYCIRAFNLMFKLPLIDEGSSSKGNHNIVFRL